MKPVVDRIGLPAMLEQTAEECAELAHACLKEARRLRGENPTPCAEEECKAAIMEEMADVALCLDMLDNSDYTLDPIIAKAKLDRWDQRLDEAGK